MIAPSAQCQGVRQGRLASSWRGVWLGKGRKECGSVASLPPVNWPRVAGDALEGLLFRHTCSWAPLQRRLSKGPSDLCRSESLKLIYRMLETWLRRIMLSPKLARDLGSWRDRASTADIMKVGLCSHTVSLLFTLPCSVIHRFTLPALGQICPHMFALVKHACGSCMGRLGHTSLHWVTLHSTELHFTQLSHTSLHWAHVPPA